ncbi:TPA: hypothetical protein EYN09_14665, partial [Candidatus Poribacteria bacterium]|nr:hypothetical protein [Candidatus Poribacteria bacterium]
MTAVACSTSVIVLLAMHNMQTEQILQARRQVVQKRTEELEDQMRKIGKGMGFNILILPEDRNHSNANQTISGKTRIRFDNSRHCFVTD